MIRAPTNQPNALPIEKALDERSMLTPVYTAYPNAASTVYAPGRISTQSAIRTQHVLRHGHGVAGGGGFGGHLVGLARAGDAGEVAHHATKSFAGSDQAHLSVST